MKRYAIIMASLLGIIWIYFEFWYLVTACALFVAMILFFSK